ncbi:carbohydrate ABC transporter permease [Gracilibacillus alcaliphilus]|uniref:carbohydrate ABC transporter permease n=1 Tax=Gracilibacillus alcaliphilus TaxID=1401441 RepID=UPI0019560747|nr:sugar ABC transporter permease [Gracilibacillus alcaliphilus]MBM7677546.1 multiple sugar transport system permease protein [Gracilibacillus alcaliphilus]
MVSVENAELNKQLTFAKNKILRKTLLFLLPSLVILLIFFIGPIIMTFFFAFTNMSLTGTTAQSIDFVGFQNFVSMFSDPNFKTSFITTMVFLIFSGIIGQQVLGFLLAVLMKNKNKTFRKFVGGTVMAGWVTPEIIVAFTFVSFLHDGGTLNQFLSWFGVEPISWLFTFPMVSVVVANIWKGSALSMLMFQSALDNIPFSVEEAAKIDGANRWQRMWRITIPMIKNTIFTNLVIITLGTLGVFTLIYTMTGGGPANATATLPIFMYEQAFVNYQLGYGTAISLVILIIGIIISLIYIRLLKTDD